LIIRAEALISQINKGYHALKGMAIEIATEKLFIKRYWIITTLEASQKQKY